MFYCKCLRQCFIVFFCIPVHVLKFHKILKLKRQISKILIHLNRSRKKSRILNITAMFYNMYPLKSQSIERRCYIHHSGLQIRVLIGKLFSLFLIQNICCGYSKEPSQ